jgi:hypothetical protein
MEDNQSFLDLQVDEPASVQLTEASRWAKFLGVTVLVALGLTILMFGMFWSRMDTILQTMLQAYDQADERTIRIIKVMIVICLAVVVVISAVLMTFLIKGANAIRVAIRHKDPALFNNGLGYLRNYLAMMGVLGIIGLLFSLMGFLVR